MRDKQLKAIDKYCDNVVELCRIYKYLLKEHTYTPEDRITLKIMFVRQLESLANKFDVNYYLN